MARPSEDLEGGGEIENCGIDLFDLSGFRLQFERGEPPGQKD